jgi:predicted O-methyltransferase YrrM
VSIIKRLSLRVRKRMPNTVRHLLRLGNHAVNRGQASAQLSAEQLADCRFTASRFDLVKLLPRGGKVVEVGTLHGDFARFILAHSEPQELHLIDIDFSPNALPLGEDARVRLHNGMSQDVLAALPDATFDWIYIDGDHSYSGCARDAEAAASKVKPGGYLVFNDFAHMDPYLGAYGVHRAVVDFAVKHGWKFAWMAYEPSALYDVALQRPLAAGK